MRMVEGKLLEPSLSERRRLDRLVVVAQWALALTGLVLLAFGAQPLFAVAKSTAPAASSLMLPLGSVASFVAFAVVGLGRQNR